MAEKQKYWGLSTKVQTLLQTICNKIECKNHGSDRGGNNSGGQNSIMWPVEWVTKWPCPPFAQPLFGALNLGAISLTGPARRINFPSSFDSERKSGECEGREKRRWESRRLQFKRLAWQKFRSNFRLVLALFASFQCSLLNFAISAAMTYKSI